MATKKTEPANRLYVFAKTCTNDHGTFAKGDKARGSFSDDLVQSYIDAGILIHASDRTSGVAQDAPVSTSAD